MGWQEIAVGLIVLGALVYVARRALARLRAFRPGRGQGACATGCGKCGGEHEQVARPTNLLVQIKPSGRAPRC